MFESIAAALAVRVPAIVPMDDPVPTADPTDAAGGAGGKVDNPFDHTTPDISVFGIDFSNKLYLVLGGIWGIAFIIAAYYLIRAFIKFMAAKKVQHNPDALEDATKDLQLSGLGTAGLGAIPVIFAALANIF